MCRDKRARVDPPSRVVAITGADERRVEFAHLEMEMRPISSVRRPDGRDLLAAMHRLLRLDHDRFDVSVIRLHEFAVAVFLAGIDHDDHVAPTGTGFPGENYGPVGYGENRIALVAVLAADPVQIVPEMTIICECLGVVGKRAVLAPDREIET